MLMFVKVFIVVLLTSYDVYTSTNPNQGGISDNTLLKRINKQILAERMQQKFGRKQPQSNWDSEPVSAYQRIQSDTVYKPVQPTGQENSYEPIKQLEIKHRYYQQPPKNLASSLSQGLRLKPRKSALAAPPQNINSDSLETNNGRPPVAHIFKGPQNEADQSSFISKPSDWNTYGRRFQVYFGVGYFYKLVRDLKCPIKNHYAVLRPLITEKSINAKGNSGIILPYKSQPTLLAKNRSLTAPRFEAGIVFYSGNGKSLNINLAGDRRKYRFFLKEAPHERKALNFDIKQALENNDLVDGEVPKFYISTEEIFDLLGDNRNFVEQQFEYEVTIGIATTVKDRWWIEAMFGISNTYLKSFDKGYHLIGLVTSVRLDYEIIRQIRLGIAYQYRTINRSVKGFKRVGGSSHAIIATFRLLVP